MAKTTKSGERGDGSKKSEAKRAAPKKSEPVPLSILEGSGDKRFRVLAGLEALLRPIGELLEDVGNARIHGDRNLEAIKDSLASRGQHAPLVVQRQGMIVRVGNGRLRAAKALGWSHVAAVVVDEDDIQASARAIADNRSSELADWDGETLVELVAELQAAGAGAGLAFDDEELAQAKGDFAAPANGEELLGSIADGLVVRASVLIGCHAIDVPTVVDRLQRALAVAGRPGWEVRQRAKQSVREIAQKLETANAAKRSVEVERVKSANART